MMNDLPRRKLPRWVGTLVVLTCAGLLLAPGPWQQFSKVGTTILEPVQLGIAGTAQEISADLGALQQIRELSHLNADYQEEIDHLQSELVRMRELEVENEDLRGLLNLKERTGPGDLLPVSVIARDDSPYTSAITIDRGTSDGAREGSVVVTHKGLVGRVVQANPTTSKVRLITDLNSAVAVRVQSESRTTGLLRGQAEGNALVIDYIPQQETMTLGEVVITSGLGESFPEGLVVGTISRVQQQDANPFQAAAVEPAVDMNSLERLYLLAEPGASDTAGN